MTTQQDAYAAAASAYDLHAAATQPARRAALEALLPRLRPEYGPILDVGAGSGVGMTAVLQRLPRARVHALEPSAAMRALIMARIAAHPDWFERVTVRPEDFFLATLPERIGGAVLLGVIGHFDPGERAAVLAELAVRLPPGGAALIELPAPERPRRVPARELTAARIGELEYRRICEAWPVDTEVMRWRVSYLTLEGERVLTEETAEHEYRHPAPGIVAEEAERVGLHLSAAGPSGFWLAGRG